jgi:hypothetical protein
MNPTKQPTKEHIRQWLMDRQRNPARLPTMEQIKSELGWHSSHSPKAQTETGENQTILAIKARSGALP